MKIKNIIKYLGLLILVNFVFSLIAFNQKCSAYIHIVCELKYYIWSVFIVFGFFLFIGLISYIDLWRKDNNENI